VYGSVSESDRLPAVGVLPRRGGGADDALQRRHSEARSDHPPRLSGLGLDEVTELAYHVMLERPTWTPAELATRLRVDSAAAGRLVRGLAELNLVHVTSDGNRLRAVSPQLGLTALAARREAELANRRRELEQGRLAIADLLGGLDDLKRRQGGRGVDVRWGATDVREHVAQLAAGALGEVIAMSASSTPQLDEAVIPVPAGCASFRFLFADTALAEEASIRRLQGLTSSGATVRTGRVPLSALIVDGAVVVLPVGDAAAGETVGVATLRLPSVVVAVVELFERLWAEAAPLGDSSANDLTAPGPRERELLALLLAGATDESAGYRLGISVRTVRRIVADLMLRLGARSRFEAGARAAERGWLRMPLEGG
jgi:DNA-binding CsgD family transcriptional regulator/DNA-binding MarR family transcriptional regulator